MTALIALLAVTDAAAASEPSPYVMTRASAAATAGGDRIAAVGSVGMGAEWDNGNSLGMRFMYAPSPPDALWLEPGPYAAGPAVDWKYYVGVSDNFDMYPAMSVGILYAPEQGTGRTLLLPVAEAGFGMRLKTDNAEGSNVWVAPQFDLIPLALGANVSLNAGMNF